ncbi:hypothetical protein AAJ72_14490 [Citromicrobium sp. RCC1885]|nr:MULTISPECIES: hypothetical protein [unclassified Citromicrobium]KPM21553.1 hypothetical protein AAJ72_14490 [Citromicrobium sp. RCC1885]KPM23522.1 hypothetical protein AAJ74_15670 [Citromicrobium sp. RCC1878]OAM06944.1 hypothetical protein A0U43_13585 [Citromicrobium sp. RCC1897]|tara:strand:- start:2740 stop:3126 length:387 start_codon:yes stop_codon:yes gene_type:complete
MCFDVETMLDRIEHGTFPKPRIALVPVLQGTCLVLIEAAGFAASTLLTVLGLPLFVFLFLAGWDLTLLFAQLGNLADHYASAEGPARIAFSRDLQLAFLVLAGGFTLLRLPSFIRRLCTKLDREMPHD